MNYLGRKIKNNFDDDLDIHGNDLEGVKRYPGKRTTCTK